MPRQPKPPAYHHHKPSGQARVRIDGRDIYLGVYGSPESYQRYEQVLAEWRAGLTAAATRSKITIQELVLAYRQHAEGYYTKHGALTKQYERVTRSIAFAAELYGTEPVDAFGPRALKAVRQKMVECGWTREHVNQCVGCLRRCFKWGVAEELVPVEVYQKLLTVEGLRAGRTEAPEPEPIRPVPEAHLKPVLQTVLPPIRAMIELQLVTAMRPGEVGIMRPCDIDTSGRVEIAPDFILDLGDRIWVYRPQRWKTEHHGQGYERIILIGPRGQELLQPWLPKDRQGYLFSPRQAWPNAGERRSRQLLEYYTVDAYDHNVKNACRRANVPAWCPNQLRHNAASRLNAEFGPEIARIILGHSSLRTTRIYIQDDLQKAADAMKKTG